MNPVRHEHEAGDVTQRQSLDTQQPHMSDGSSGTFNTASSMFSSSGAPCKPYQSQAASEDSESLTASMAALRMDRNPSPSPARLSSGSGQVPALPGMGSLDREASSADTWTPRPVLTGARFEPFDEAAMETVLNRVMSEKELAPELACTALAAYALLKFQVGRVPNAAHLLIRRCCNLLASDSLNLLTSLSASHHCWLIYGSSEWEPLLWSKLFSRDPQALQEGLAAASINEQAMCLAGLKILQRKSQDVGSVLEAVRNCVKASLEQPSQLQSPQLGSLVLSVLIEAAGGHVAGSFYGGRPWPILVEEAEKYVRGDDLLVAAGVLRSLVTCDAASSDLLAVTAQTLCGNVQSEPPEGALGALLCCLAHARYSPGQPCLQQLTDLASGWKGQRLVEEGIQILWSCSQLGFLTGHVPLLTALEAESSCLASISAPQAARLAWCLALLEGNWPQLTQQLRTALARILPSDFTEPLLIKICQAELATMGTPFSPPLLRQRAELAWRRLLADWKPSQAADEVSEALKELGIPHKRNVSVEGSLQICTIMLSSPTLALQVDGPDAFTANEPYEPLGTTVLAWRSLKARRVVRVPHLVGRTSCGRRHVTRAASGRRTFGPSAAVRRRTGSSCGRRAADGTSRGRSPDVRGRPAGGPSGVGGGLGRAPDGAPGFGVGRPTDRTDRSHSRAHAWQVAQVPFYVWSALGTPSRQQAYLMQQIEHAREEAASQTPPKEASMSPAQSTPSSTQGGAGDAPCTTPAGLSAASPQASVPGLALAQAGALSAPVHGLSAASSEGTGTDAVWRGGHTLTPPGGDPPLTGSLPPGGQTSTPPYTLAPPAGAPYGMGWTDPATAWLGVVPGSHGSLGSHTVCAAIPVPPPGGMQPLSIPLVMDPSVSVPALLEAQPEALQVAGDDIRRMWNMIGGLEMGYSRGQIPPTGGGGVVGSRTPPPGASPWVPTVAELSRIIEALPLETSAVVAVAPCLHHFSAIQFSALMTELARGSHAFRAWQLFDWLRSLPEDHQLQRQLLDAHTYTTMITLCGTWQQLRRALELVDDMRKRSLECGLQAYTALLVAAVKGGEADLALDVYQQMGAEGMARNRDIFVTMVDLHVRQGALDHALQVLADMKAAGKTPEVHLYNVVLVACTKQAQPRLALEVYQRMLADEVTPNTKTFTALIGSVGKGAPLSQMLDLVTQLLAAGPSTNHFATYTSLMSACEKGGLWELALALFDRICAEGVQVDVAVFNSIIAACAHSGQHAKASATFDRMREHDCTPDAVTYANLIRAYKKGGQWCHALATFEAMQANGSQPHTAVFSSIIDVLLQTGILWAQAKALQLFTAAVTAGNLAPAVESHKKGVLKVDLQALTVGVAVLSMAAWLSGARDSIQHDVENSLDASHKVAIVNGLTEQTRAQGHSAAVKETVGAALQGCHAPFKLVQDHSRSGRLEASSPVLRSWLFTPHFNHYLSLIQGDGSVLVDTSKYLEIEREEAAKCSQLFAQIHAWEQQNPISLKALHERAGAYLQVRKAMMGHLFSFATLLQLGQEAVHCAAGHMDRVMASGVLMSEAFQHLFICACLRIACVQEGQPPPSPIAIQQLTGHSVVALERMEANINQVLHSKREASTTVQCLKLYIQRLGCQLHDAVAVQKVAGMSFSLALDALYDLPVLQFPPSLLAAAIFHTARKMQGSVPFWPSVLAAMTGYSEPSSAAFVAAISHAERLRSNLAASDHMWMPHL